MSSAKQITVSYTVHPPSILNADTIKSLSAQAASSATTSYPISSTPASAQSDTFQYYTAAATTLREAQKGLNESLTIWKDAIGDKEKSKEDLGVIGYGKGRAARMSAAVNGDLRAEKATVDDETSSDESEES